MPDIQQHIDGVTDSHQNIVHLVEAVRVGNDLLEERREHLSVPVEEAASRRLLDLILPVADVFEGVVLLRQVDDVLFFEHVSFCAQQVVAVADDSLSDCVVAALLAFNDGHDELLHADDVSVWLLILLLHPVELMQALVENARNKLVGLTVDKDDPLVDEELLGLELDLNGLQHFDSLNDFRKVALVEHLAVHLVEHQVLLQVTLNLSGQLDAIQHQVTAFEHVAGVVDHVHSVLQVVRVHQDNPLDQAHVVPRNILLEKLLVRHQLRLKEIVEVRRIKFGLLFAGQGAYIGKEVARAKLEVVVEDENGAVVLQCPDVFVQLYVFILLEELSEH